jgi:hypothetical protein
MSGTPEIGTIVLSAGFPKLAASHCVAPSYDRPIIPTDPLLQSCLPNQVIAWSMSARSAGPMRFMHPPASAVPRIARNATA